MSLVEIEKSLQDLVSALGPVLGKVGEELSLALLEFLVLLIDDWSAQPCVLFYEGTHRRDELVSPRFDQSALHLDVLVDREQRVVGLLNPADVLSKTALHLVCQLLGEDLLRQSLLEEVVIESLGRLPC